METAQRMVDEAAERAFAKSKNRDEDGKLVKVYHGTDADFTVFDRAMGRANMDIQGMFFSPWDIDAGGCTDQAVKQFQKANGLDVDGIVGVDTWRVLTGAA